ncbi:hypothetical protein Salat_1424100 [Sesamum alatum]|uniref:DUF4283 domain-containing protein n=1 Tax=Sesamum alatum TaxID=300844 RepID=A0AAE1YAJ7_9LAMI|nr:hypothetical protein Salat_1424100 [Sesamum alatum]
MFSTKSRVLEGRPWAFHKNLLLLNELSVDENPLEVELNWSAFHVHVHVHSLSLWQMTSEMAALIGNRLGAILKAAWPIGGMYVGVFCISKVAEFLYVCGLLGHIDRYCERRCEERFMNPGWKHSMESGCMLWWSKPQQGILVDGPVKGGGWQSHY